LGVYYCIRLIIHVKLVFLYNVRNKLPSLFNIDIFDPSTRTLHIISSDAEVEISEEEAHRAKIVINPEPSIMQPVPLRRTRCLHEDYRGQKFFSTKDHEIHIGSYSSTIDGVQSDDLVAVQKTIIYG
jgi:hypothetical protein